ncbi:YafY family protein [Clostridium sp. JN-1]|uniref:helix-turn-helix transcriptional regulator n=1 Tax=Clostridium sp. JN-1 TaxID=2483110 RepID=UPI000F0B53CF|nr:YafY family protein [Clostridium sp. JN-1]
MKINRLLAIIVLLLNREKVSASELAEKFEVSVRTIYRDIDTINMSGIPITSQSGNNGGFYIVENYKISHQFLTLKDMISIVEALKNINGVLNNDSVDLAIEKVKSIVPENKKEKFNMHFKQIFIDTLPWGFKKSDGEYLKYKIIIEALENRNCLSFNYMNAKGEYTFRKVEPITLVFKGFGWYLFSFCTMRNDYRIFKLSRIRNLNVLNKKICNSLISYEKYLNKNNTPKNTIKLVLKFSEKVKCRIIDYFDKDEITFNGDSSSIVRTEVIEDNWIYSMILSYGEYVEVLEHENIRQAIKYKCQKILDIYK